MPYKKIVELAVWTALAGALGAVVGVPLNVHVVDGALIGAGADVLAFALRVANARRRDLEGELDDVLD